jgi:hypothetical protein
MYGDLYLSDRVSAEKEETHHSICDSNTSCFLGMKYNLVMSLEK